MNQHYGLSTAASCGLSVGLSIMLCLFGVEAYAENGIRETVDGNDIQPRYVAREFNQRLMNLTAQTAYVTPTKRLQTPEYPRFSDDMNLEDMELAIERQLQRFRQRSLKGTIQFGNDVYPQKRLSESLEQFLLLTRATRTCLGYKNADSTQCWSAFNSEVGRLFAVYVPDLKPEDPRYGEPNPVFFTGYYTPHLKVTTKPQGAIKHPIYTAPRVDWQSRLPRFDIDFQGRLGGLSLELFYGDDLFEIYQLQVEGGGHVTYETEKGIASSYLTYAGSNKRPWRFISTKMIDEGYISDPSVASQREFLKKNPNLHADIFSYCPGYVYFRQTNHPPWGSDQVPLTDNRSIATDYRLYPFKGILAYVSARRPKPLKGYDSVDFTRFVLDQDTGGAIKGKGRVDFYFGEGDYAEHAATTMTERGDLYFLILKGP